jgi:class 3 adenylate cyclase
LASYLTSCPQAWINIIDKDTQHCKIDYGQNSVLSYMSSEIPRGLTVCQFVLNNNCEPLVIEDCSLDERTKLVAEAGGGGFPKLDGLRLLADQFVELLDTRQVEAPSVNNDDKLAVNGDYYSSATILFADFVGFTQKTEEIQPGELLEILSSYFNGFDQIMERFGLKKVKTIGDAYMAIGGVPDKNSGHAVQVCKAAQEMIKYVNGMGVQQEALGKDSWKLRVGINTGSVIAGNTGNNFDIWGDAVNVAARLESSGEEGKIQISEKTKQFLPKNAKVTFREKVHLKNKGEMDTFFLDEI